MKKLIYFGVFFWIILLPMDVHAQSGYSVGVTVAGETNQGVVNPDFGVFFEKRISKSVGAEIGLNLRTRVDDNSYIDPLHGNWPTASNVKVGYLSFPLLFNFSSKVNVSAGMNVDVFVGNSFLSFSDDRILPNYTHAPKALYGCVFKVSKDLRFTQDLALEPGVYFNPLLNVEDVFMGFSLKIKYTAY